MVMTMLFWMLVGHALADYPLQGDFLAKAKNHRQPIPGVPWIHGLLWHAVIHGGAVALATGSMVLGCAEIAAHAAIDFSKSSFSEGADLEESRILFHVDQVLHFICKVAWALIAAHT